MTESDILYETPDHIHWVMAATFGSGRFKPKSHGFKVLQQTATHSKVVAMIGYPGAGGLERAKQEADRRAAA